MTYRYVNIALESLSIVICMILIIYQIFEKKPKDESDKWYTSMLGFNILMLWGDLCDWIFGGMPGIFSYTMQLTFAIIIYFSASGMLLFSLFGWIASFIKQKIIFSKIWVRIGMVLVCIQIIFAFTMPIHRICYIGENNYYARSNLFLLTQICPYLIYFMAMWILIWHHRVFKKKELIYLSVIVIVPLIAEVIQVITYKYMALNVTISLGLIIIFTFIQSKRELDSKQMISDLVQNENQKLEEMQQFQHELSHQLMEVLGKTVEKRDLITSEHSKQVAMYAKEITRRLGGSEEQQDEMYYIGILHDIGKIGVSGAIINKQGRFSDEEYQQMKRHTDIGFEILSEVSVFPNLAAGAKYHHEWYDGYGYPEGLSGEDIPYVARIISVADAYDAMTSFRSYHSHMDKGLVKEQIRKGSGSQFDPQIAKVMMEIIDEEIALENEKNNSKDNDKKNGINNVIDNGKETGDQA